MKRSIPCMYLLLLVVLAHCTRAEGPDPNLVAYWSFDDGTTTVKILVEGSDEPKGFRVGDGDDLVFPRRP